MDYFSGKQFEKRLHVLFDLMLGLHNFIYHF
jgi:hypothetical protein